MYELINASDGDYDFCKKVGHEGLKPYIEILIGWDQDSEDEGFRKHWAREQIKIIQCQGEAVGYIKIEQHPEHVLIDGIYVSEKWRRNGIGKKVLEDVINESSLPITLQVYKINPAYHLYRRLGFRVTVETDIRYHMAHIRGT